MGVLKFEKIGIFKFRFTPQTFLSKRLSTARELSTEVGIPRSKVSYFEYGHKASEKEKEALTKGLCVKVVDINWPNS